jgi:hypothetical protein
MPGSASSRYRSMATGTDRCPALSRPPPSSPKDSRRPGHRQRPGRGLPALRPDPVGLPPDFARLLASYPAAERAHGARLAAAAIQQFTHPVPDDQDTHELIVTHNFLIGYLVA